MMLLLTSYNTTKSLEAFSWCFTFNDIINANYPSFILAQALWYRQLSGIWGNRAILLYSRTGTHTQETVVSGNKQYGEIIYSVPGFLNIEKMALC